jgi:hypothetical protein
MGYPGGSVRQGVISVSDRFRPNIASVTPGLKALGSAPLRGPLDGLRGGWGADVENLLQTWLPQLAI